MIDARTEWSKVAEGKKEANWDFRKLLQTLPRASRNGINVRMFCGNVCCGQWLQKTDYINAIITGTGKQQDSSERHADGGSL